VRFCMVTTFFPPFNFGGDGIAVERLARALVRQGHEVTVVHDVDTFHALGGTLQGLPADEVVEGVRILRLTSRFGVVSPLLVHQLGRPVLHRRRLRALLAPGNFEVVHYHNVSLVGGAGLLTWKTGAVTAYTAHDFWLVCPTHHLWRHGRELCRSRECFRCVLRHRRPPQLWRNTEAVTRGLREVDIVIALSEFSRIKHREFGLEREMVVLPNFLSVPELGKVKAEAPPLDRPYFFFAGRLVKIKGLDDVISVFREFPAADLVVAGDGAHRAALERKATGAANIRFLGWLPPAELTGWYQHARAVVFPSLCWEQFPLVWLEAAAAGVPLIARRLDSAAEYVTTSGAGELFESPEELRAALERFLGNPEYRREVAEQGRRALSERWTETVVLPRYLELIREAADRRGIDLERRPGARASSLAPA
jgi:glycosyltransferase involved in cell wall biosynthesis